jgi:hypothetical protein
VNFVSLISPTNPQDNVANGSRINKGLKPYSGTSGGEVLSDESDIRTKYVSRTWDKRSQDNPQRSGTLWLGIKTFYT